MNIFLCFALLLGSVSAFSKAAVCVKTNADGSTTTTTSDGSCPKGSKLVLSGN